MSLCVCVRGNTDTKERAKAARCGECKTCLNPKSKRKCLDPKPQEQQAAATAAAAFSSPVTRRRPAGRGSLLLVVVVGGYADGASEHPNPENL